MTKGEEMKKIILLLLFFVMALQATTPTQESITKLYIATFQRAPDKEGLDFWLYKSNFELEQIAQSFFDQEETRATYPKGSSNDDFIRAIYKNLFNRDPDDGGFNYWLEELDRGTTQKSVFILAVVNGATGNDATILQNKTTVGLVYASRDGSNVDEAKAIMRDINADPKTVADTLQKYNMLQDGSTKTVSGVEIEIESKSDWNDGFCADVIIHNTTADTITWSAEFDARGIIYDMWNSIYSQDKETLQTTIRGVDWNAQVEAGESVTVGYCANKVAQKLPPTSTATTQDGVLKVTQSINAEWNEGFCRNIKVTNSSDSDLVWSITDSVEGDIYTLWNAVYTQDPDTKVLKASGVEWNKVVKAHQSVEFGYCANKPSSGNSSSNNPSNGGSGDSESGGNTHNNSGGSFSAPDYAKVLKLSLEFYEAQRSAGPFPVVTWRQPAGLSDGSDVGRDLSGGWFDAGDGVKFNLPMAYSATMLNWGMITFADSYNATGAMSYGKEQVKYALDYFIQAYNEGGNPNDPSDDIIYYQVGDVGADHSFWGPPQDMTMSRPTYSCSSSQKCSEVAGEMAAAMASGAIVFSSDNGYSSLLLDRAKKIYEFGKRYQGNNGYTATQGAYSSHSGYNDELAWAATWLYLATSDNSYLDDAKSFISRSNDTTYWAHNWDDVGNGTKLLLYTITRDSRYKSKLDSHFSYWLNSINYTAGGLAFLDGWGSLRYSANTAFLSLAYAKSLPLSTQRTDLINFAKGEIEYMLGNNPRNSSYLIGYGVNYPINPHHRASHNSPTHNISSPTNNEFLLNGALVGGPRSADDFDYDDNREDYKANEVATDYNAGFVGAVAGLLSLQ
jgi:hypothetical protein